MKNTKKVIEIIILSLLAIVLLWLGAFLLRDKNELFCKMSFGKYTGLPATYATTVGSIKFNYTCTGSPIFDLFNN